MIKNWQMYTLMLVMILAGSALAAGPPQTPNKPPEAKVESIGLTQDESNAITGIQAQIDLLIEKQKVLILTAANNHAVSMKTHRLVSQDGALVFAPVPSTVVNNVAGANPTGPPGEAGGIKKPQ